MNKKIIGTVIALLSMPLNTMGYKFISVVVLLIGGSILLKGVREGKNRKIK